MDIQPAGKVTSERIGLPERPEKTGFASQPAEHILPPLDVNDLVAPQRMTTFFFEAQGSAANPQEGVSIFNGDTIVVDRSLPISNGALVLADNTEQFIVRRIRIEANQAWLVAEDPGAQDIEILDERSVVGVVTFVIHRVVSLRTGE